MLGPARDVWEIEFLAIWVRPAAAAWEKHYSELFESKGFIRGESCGVIFYHPQMDVAMAVHGDDFTLCGGKRELIIVQKLSLIHISEPTRR